ncbi:phosphate ABC transporter substrate-binding protein PstS [Allokutzneria sp. A3M-2-11 16]|uniref:phosphate ABC transporter substrate-binding protein PstS n=1 Tax=Allokutzneria sp. A3M-2-11 16 TaxID=2962043 RepID=UPI0020B8EC71|nr:phosphate ABC transporter substrate-binding protein PstS [Allokutzneria sp. A3M-2-11 16]MCP3799137.1 phosphate ABC transporter substrate-binding protein PstS [Allokutzneria sp. A3M-2-11 16]
MKIKQSGAAIGLVAVGALLLSACGSDNNTGAQGTSSSLANLSVECGGKANISAEGSSAQKNAMDIFAKDFQAKCQGQKIAYTKSGSGKGISQFTAKQIDFGGTDSPLSKEKGEVDKAAQRCEGNPAWNLPLVFGPVALAYNLPNVNNVVLNGELAAKIFSGQITKWNDPALAAVNPGAALPDKKIVVIYRSDESGTTENFQTYLKTAAPQAWTKGGGKKFTGGVGEGKESSDGVSSATKSTDGAITYVEWSFAKNAKLGIAKVDTGAGAVELTSASAAKAIDGAQVKGTGNDLVLDLNSIYGTKAAGAYPLLLATYEVVCSKGYDADTTRAVKAFLTVAANASASELEAAGYVALPETFKKKLTTAVSAIA